MIAVNGSAAPTKAATADFGNSGNLAGSTKADADHASAFDPPPLGVIAPFGGRWLDDGSYWAYGESAGGRITPVPEAEIRCALGELSIQDATRLIQWWAWHATPKAMLAILNEMISDDQDLMWTGLEAINQTRQDV